MLIHFRTTKLEKIFSSEKELTRAYGAEQGRVLMRRVSELKAARCLADLRLLPQLRAHELTGDRKGQISITVRHPYRLILLPANEPIPRLPDGGLDWAAATEVKVIEIVDYHCHSKTYHEHHIQNRLRLSPGRYACRNPRSDGSDANGTRAAHGAADQDHQ